MIGFGALVFGALVSLATPAYCSAVVSSLNVVLPRLIANDDALNRAQAHALKIMSLADETPSQRRLGESLLKGSGQASVESFSLDRDTAVRDNSIPVALDHLRLILAQLMSGVAGGLEQAASIQQAAPGAGVGPAVSHVVENQRALQDVFLDYAAAVGTALDRKADASDDFSAITRLSTPTSSQLETAHEALVQSEARAAGAVQSVAQTCHTHAK